jgi:hypothetical protein
VKFLSIIILASTIITTCSISAVQAAPAPAPSPAPAGNPVYQTHVYIDGIFGGDSQGRIREVVDMLKNGDQKILDVKVLGQNAYGKILHAAVVHTSALNVTPAVMEEAKVLRVTIDGIWGGNSCQRISSQISTLKAAEQKILRVEVTGYNGYGKILSANIHYISTYRYDAITNAATPPAAH